jgi:secondary thiamine-phosphate synthase enzyme
MIELKTIRINTPKREILMDITREVEAVISDSDIENGVCKLFVPHTTAAITINENADPDVKIDIINFLRQLIPKNADFRHGEGNSDAHIKSTIVGPSLEILINKKRLVLGTWQGIMFSEFDGPRNRKLHIQLQGE